MPTQTELTIGLYVSHEASQDDTDAWGSVFNTALATGEIKEITILYDNIPLAENNFYFY